MANLTDSKLKKGYPSKEKRYYIADQDNLILIVHPTGKQVFTFRYRWQDKKPKITLGTYGENMTLHQARTEASRLYSIYKNGGDPKQSHKGENNESTFQDFFTRYDQQALTSLVSRKNQIMMVAKDVNPVIGNKKLNKVTTSDLYSIFDKMKARGSSGQANRLYARLNHFFRWAVSRQYIHANPLENVRKIDVGQAEKKRTRYLAQDEIRYFWDWVEEQKINDSFKLAYKILLLTGQRVSTLCKAEWVDVDLKKGTWFIPAKNQKTNIAQFVVLAPITVGFLKALKKRSIGSGFVIPSPKDSNRPVTKDSLSQALKRSIDSELAQGDSIFKESFIAHDFRRTLSSNMNERLPELAFAIEKILSHSLTGVLAVYNKAEYREQKQKVWFEWAGIVEALIADEKVTYIRQA